MYRQTCATPNTLLVLGGHCDQEELDFWALSHRGASSHVLFSRMLESRTRFHAIVCIQAMVNEHVIQYAL